MFFSNGNKDGKSNGRHNSKPFQDSAHRLIKFLESQKIQINDVKKYDELKKNLTSFQILARYKLSPKLLQRALCETKLQFMN